MDAEVLIEQGAHRFTDRICRAMGLYAYTAIGTRDADGNVVVCAGWAGEVPQGVDSRAPHVAFGKLGELNIAGAGLDGNLIMTPIRNSKLGYGWIGFGWMGGVAQNGLMVTVSKLAQEHDRLIALITLYNREHQNLQLHHVGVRFTSKALYEAANNRPGGMVRNVVDHDRTYYWCSEGYYTEYQWFPDGPHTDARHWDFVVSDPRRFLMFVANAYDQEPVFFDDASENDPIGVVWVTDEKGKKYGIMAREGWWQVEKD